MRLLFLAFISLILFTSGCIQNNQKAVQTYACQTDDDCVVTYSNRENCCPALCSGEIVNKEENKIRGDWIKSNCDMKNFNIKNCPVADCALESLEYNKYVPKCIDSKCVTVKSK